MLEEIYLPDSSAIIRGIIKKKLNEINGKIVVHLLLVDLFEKMAKEGKNLGIIGLKEMNILREVQEKYKDRVVLEYSKELPEGYRYLPQLTSLEEIDRIIRELALEWKGTLITCNEVQYTTAKALGIKALYEKVDLKTLSFERLFSSNIMSIHLKENLPPYAKKGKPGNWSFIRLSDKALTKLDLEEIEREIIEKSRVEGGGFIEIERTGSSIVQYKNYRIVITRPPFSDGVEITIVKPLVNLSLEDYNLSQKLIERLEKRAEGILIAGAPGMGKTTFAQALANHYIKKGKIIKTIESPRDMQLPNEATQYSKNYASSEEIHDVLLLSRPDYTFFDEMRDTKDFELYADLRLAGVGMVGVVHATSPIDAIQRFVGRIELGMIPSIIDTVIFIKNGEINKVYELETMVKVPYGLKEVDLARPVVVVKNFLTNEPEYELYVFGERTFVVPIKRRIDEREYRIRNSIEKTLSKYVSKSDFDISLEENGSVYIMIEPEYATILSNRILRKLRRLGKRYGISIEVKPRI